MKKLLSIIVLGFLLSGNANANIYELNKCISIPEHKAKYDKVKWSQKLYERHNTIYYLFHDKPKKMLGSDMYNVAVWVPGDAADDETISEFEEEGWNKIQWRENSSYTIDLNNKLITELKVYTDEYLDFERERIFKLTELYKKKGIYNKHKKNLNRIIKKRIIKEYKIEQFVGNLIIAHAKDQYKYYPKERFAIMINLDDLSVAFDQVKSLNNQIRLSFNLCGTNNDSDENNKNSTSTNKPSKKNNSTLKSILKMLN